MLAAVTLNHLGVVDCEVDQNHFGEGSRSTPPQDTGMDPKQDFAPEQVKNMHVDC